ncbi:RNase A-like domain-containing protein [Silvibacterium dinghuense]|uniref:DUF4225 domain-containing protein n=1 Tax=Silvibacterium dinghuense TaxID=1560006 RepID=A0A4Q1S9Q3_9BACT|nr:RNase A-like domain-containing protein [Silvibacterium dinghuense]RXS93707.1 DUF4225 domain-containing protein [Silvibacterium dinghuense]GGH07018.1 hypothetical protein GCM10011586_24030 [Silvibacterium dinghuense]
MAEVDDGLTIVLSPAQLAAVLQAGQLENHQRLVNRLWGGAQLVFSALQIVGGGAMFLVPEPTMLTKVGGGVLIAHGADSGQAAVRQLWTGEETEDFTQMAGEKLAHSLGASDQAAHWAGVGLDVAVPLAVSLVLGAERILAVRAGRISLAEEELAGGHTIREHINRTETDLRDRLVKQPKIPAATTWSSVRVAEDVISDTIRTNKQTIEQWAMAGGKGNLRLVYSGSSPVGEGVIRATGKLETMTKARIILKRTQVAGRVWFVLTAFPEP